MWRWDQASCVGQGVRLSLGPPQALPWSRTCPLWPCPQSRPDAGELEEVPPSQTSSPGEQKRELADSVDGVTASVCVGTQRCGATLASLRPGVLAEEGATAEQLAALPPRSQLQGWPTRALSGHLHVCLPLAWKALPLGGRSPEIFALQIPKQRASSRLVYIC